MLRTIGVVAAILLLPALVAADTLRLVPGVASPPGPIQLALRKPFEVDLVMTRDDPKAQSSAVAYTLEVPDGVLLVGEELLVDTLLGLGSSRAGMNLVFRCSDQSPLHVLRLRFVATHPIDHAIVALRPEKKTQFLGIVACKEQSFAKFECAMDSLVVTAH